MINQILDINNKTEELKKYIKEVEDQQKKAEQKSTCKNIIKNFSNLEIMLPKKILLTKLEASQGESLFFQCLIDLSLVSSDYVYFSLVIGDIVVQKYRKKLQAGENQVSILQNYTPITSGEIEIYLQLYPKNEKAITVGQISLFVWGNFTQKTETNYQILETNDNYLLSFLDNNTLYYKLTQKAEGEYATIDFNEFCEAKSYSFAFMPVSKKLLLFRVDSLGNLFYMNFEDKNENFICDNVSFVSACSSANDLILVSIVREYCCYYFEFDTNNNTSKINRLKNFNIKIHSCTNFYNSFTNEFYIVVSTKNGENYLFQEKLQDSKVIENINAKYLITAEIYDNSSQQEE